MAEHHGIMTVRAPDPKEISAKWKNRLDEAETLLIADGSSHVRALEIIRDSKLAVSAIEELFASPKADANNVHKFICNMEKMATHSHREAARVAEEKAIAYEQEERKRAEQEARKAEEETRKREEERRLRAACAAEENGNCEAAEALLEAPIIVPTVSREPRVSTVDGLGTRTTYEVELTDIVRLVEFVAENQQFRNLLAVNFPAANAMARAQREGFAIPGLRLAVKSSKVRRA